MEHRKANGNNNKDQRRGDGSAGCKRPGNGGSSDTTRSRRRSSGSLVGGDGHENPFLQEVLIDTAGLGEHAVDNELEQGGVVLIGEGKALCKGLLGQEEVTDAGVGDREDCAFDVQQDNLVLVLIFTREEPCMLIRGD